MLSYGSASGVTIVEYAANPSGAIPAGIQHNDVEHLNLTYEYHPWNMREVDTAWATVGIIQQGEVETDWIHLIGTIVSGDPAYVGPSGMITNSVSFGGLQIGHFLSVLTGTPHLVTYRGLGFTRKAQEFGVITIENDPNDRVLVQSDGFAKIRIDQHTIMRSQS